MLLYHSIEGPALVEVFVPGISYGACYVEVPIEVEIVPQIFHPLFFFNLVNIFFLVESRFLEYRVFLIGSINVTTCKNFGVLGKNSIEKESLQIFEIPHSTKAAIHNMLLYKFFIFFLATLKYKFMPLPVGIPKSIKK